MKKLVYCLVVAVLAFVGWYLYTDNGIEVAPTEVSLSGVEVDSTIPNDYAVVNDSVAIFYETQVTLENDLDSTYSANVVSVVNVFQKRDSAYMFTHLVGSDSLSVVNDFWMEDSPIDFNSIISFKDALDSIANSDLYPHVKFVTLRRPLGPNVTNPYYIFAKVAAVDAVDGRVMTFEQMMDEIFVIKTDSTAVADSVAVAE